jgi:UDP-2,3-diacylglucosamine pyrophosphatase LpxH
MALRAVTAKARTNGRATLERDREAAPPTHNLLILSDVHLGSDLVYHVRPDAPRRLAGSRRRDRQLIALLRFYRVRRLHRRPWRLVIAGDLIDFVGMSVPRQDHVMTDLTREERQNGLGGAVDHTLAKLRLVHREHRPVFAALARFVAAGHSLVIVRGNHDVDLHWQPVQRAFVRCLSEHAKFDPEQIVLEPWFYYEPHVAYIEHGHQYDRYCSYEHVLHPVSPSDPRRSSRSLSDILLRTIVRPTRGLMQSGHDNFGVFDYIRFGIRLGARGMAALSQRFGSAVVATLRVWAEQYTEASERMVLEHERKMRLLAETKQMPLSRLQALGRLQKAPVTRSLAQILASVMLDRVLMALAAIALVVGLTLASGHWWEAVMNGAWSLLLVGGFGLAWSKLRSSTNPCDELRERSVAIAEHMPARYVVMGHTHVPEMRADASRPLTYVNLGAWAEDEREDGSPPELPASRTYLVVDLGDKRPRAEFLVWNGRGRPTTFPASDTRDAACRVGPATAGPQRAAALSVT